MALSDMGLIQIGPIQKKNRLGIIYLRVLSVPEKIKISGF